MQNKSARQYIDKFLNQLKKYKLEIYVILFILLLTLGALNSMGRIPYCECGYIKLWHGVTQSSENSQHLFDFYTFTHVIHGFIFAAILFVVNKFRKIEPMWGFILAFAIESSWEIIENTSFVIERYRAATISLDYYGDSIINSLGDIIAMSIGFLLASKLPLWASILIVIAIEVILAILIRDNLSLNIIMLIYPLQFIRNWQMGV